MSNQTEGVPYLDLASEFQTLRDDWIAAIDQIGSRAAFILGDAVSEFQQEVADYIGCRHALGVANGTDALVLSLRALDIGPGDEVITSPFTFFATASAVNLRQSSDSIHGLEASKFFLAICVRAKPP